MRLLPIKLPGIALACALACSTLPSRAYAENGAENTLFTFFIVGDMRNYAADIPGRPYSFQGACEAVKKMGKGAFMLGPGDLEPPGDVYRVIQEVLGEDYIWYPVPGNHDADGEPYMAWLRNHNQGGTKLPYIVRPGPANGRETTYSFDYMETHFIGLNLYYTGSTDAGGQGISDALYNWLKEDLEANRLERVFVFAHSPILPAPDFDSGATGATTYSMNTDPENTHRFFSLLREHEVDAYICGHTHQASAVYLSGLWQLDSGHCRGIRERGSRSSFARVLVRENEHVVEFWRRVDTSDEYILSGSVVLSDSKATGDPAEENSYDPSRALFSFDITAGVGKFAGPDYQSSDYFTGALQAIDAAGRGAFMLGLGDHSPGAADVYQTVRKIMGEDYPWYPVVGGRDLASADDLAWLKSYSRDIILPGASNNGPVGGEETSYSFDYNNTHFVVLDQYYIDGSEVGKNGDVSDGLYAWLESDLAANSLPRTFVFGYMPMLPAQDMDNGIGRFDREGLNHSTAHSHRFRTLLCKYGVDGYFCSAFKSASILDLNGVWQVNACHSSGLGSTAAPSTFLRVLVFEDDPVVEFWRTAEGEYRLASAWRLKARETVYAPDITLSDTLVDIGNVTVGRQFGKNFSVMNLGNEELEVFSIESDNPDFTVAPASVTLEPGGGSLIEVTFSAGSAGSHRALVSVASEDMDEPVLTVSVAATGLELGAKVAGALQFISETGKGIKYSSPALAEDGTIYIGSRDKSLHAFSPDGSRKWEFPTGSYLESSPAVGPGGTVYFGSYDKFLYALNPDDGGLKWKYETGDKIHSSPAVTGSGVVYIGSNDYCLHAVSASDGTLEWKFETGDAVKSSPAVGEDGTVYFGSTDGFLYALNSSGEQLWKFQTGDKITASPALGEHGVVYFGSLDKFFYAVNPDGTLDWKFETGGYIKGSPAVDGLGGIYFGSMDGFLYCLSSSGEVNWSFYVGDWLLSSPALGEDGTVYIGADDNNLYAVYSGNQAGLAESSWPKFGADRGNTSSTAAGAAEPAAGTCDFNGDGKISITDVIALLLFQRANPGNLGGDFNGDGSASITDAVAMLLAMRDGTCPDAGTLLASATGDAYLLVTDRLENFALDDIEYLEEMLAQMNLTPGQEAAFRSALYGEAGAARLPKVFSLAQNSPNPFNPATTIAYSVPEGASVQVTLKVFDLRGRLVRSLVNELREPGAYSVFWGGRNEAGRQVASGVYLYRMTAGDFVQTRKMVLLK